MSVRVLINLIVFMVKDKLNNKHIRYDKITENDVYIETIEDSHLNSKKKIYGTYSLSRSEKQTHG